MNFKRLAAIAAGFSVLGASAAQAHTGVGMVAGVTAGFVHPIGGLDHVLAMVAVGVLAAQQGGRALWFLPLSFVAMMAVGGAFGAAGAGMPFVEQGILGSIVILGAVLALGRALRLPLAMALVGALAVFHGHAHGTEMPVDAAGVLYGLGFMAATAVLHATGIAAASAAQKLAQQAAPLAVRFGGGAIATAGLLLAA